MLLCIHYNRNPSNNFISTVIIFIILVNKLCLRDVNHIVRRGGRCDNGSRGQNDVATSQGMQTASRTGNHKGVISPQASGRNMAQLLTHFRRLISRAAREHTWVVLSSPLL